MNWEEFAASKNPWSWLKPRLKEGVYLARAQCAGRSVLINTFYFYSLWHNHDEFKTYWLAELMFKHSLSGWFDCSFGGCLRAITMCIATSK